MHHKCFTGGENVDECLQKLLFVFVMFAVIG